MTENESRQFLKELLLAFPAFDDAARNSPDLGGTHKSWAKAWSDLQLSECISVLDTLIKSGGISWDDYRQPGPFIRRLVLDSRKAGAQSERDTATAIERERNIARSRNYKGSPMAAALAKAFEMKQAGEPEKKILAAIDAAFPAAAAYNSPSYRCPLCSDRGLVRVVRTDTARKVADLDMDAEKLNGSHTYMVACTCSAGSVIEQRQPGRLSGKMPVYNPSSFCQYHDDGEDSQRLTNWLATRKPKNYDDSFERWSA